MKHFLRMLPWLLLVLGSFPQARAATPTVPSSGATWHRAEGNYLSFYWTNGNGDRRLVIARAGQPVSAVPTNGTTYTANNVFGQGTEIKPGEFVVGMGNINQLVTRGLTSGVQYFFAVYEYNGDGATSEFLVSNYMTANQLTASAPTQQIDELAVTSITGNSARINWKAGNGYAHFIVAREEGTAPVDPSDFQKYNGNANFGSGALTGPGNYVIYSWFGGPETDIRELKNNTRYHISAYALNGWEAPVYKKPAATISFTTLSEPTRAPSGFGTNGQDTRQCFIYATPGNGSKRIFIGRKGSPVTAVPQDGITYAANPVFGQGSRLGTDEFVLYAGTGNSVWISGLDPASTYHFRVYEFEDGQTTDYLTTAYAEGTSTTLGRPTTGASAITISDIRAFQMDVNWTKGNGNNRIIIGKANSAVDVTPEDFRKYNGSTNFGRGEEIGNGNFVLAYGNYSNITVTQLQPGVTYHFAVFEAGGYEAPMFHIPAATASATTEAKPTTHPSGLNVANATVSTLRVYSNMGNGTKLFIIGKEGSAPTADPVDKTIYQASWKWKDGQEIAPGEFVIHSGTWDAPTVNSLDPNKTYYFKVLNYNEINGEPFYYTAAPTPVASGTTLDYARPQASAFGVTDITHTSMKVTFTPGGGARRIVVYKAGAPVDQHPRDNSGYGAGSNLGDGNFVAGMTSTGELQINNLTAGTTYHFAVYEMLGSQYFYTLPPLTGSATTTGQTQTITFPDLPAKTYGDADFAPGASASSGLQVTYEFSTAGIVEVVNNQFHILKSGSTTVTAKQAGDGTYAPAAPVSRTLRVAKAPLTVTADNKTITLGDPIPTFTATYAGFVNGESEAVLTRQPVMTTAATGTTAGNFSIDISGATAANYDITHVPGMLTIQPPPRKPQTIDFKPIGQLRYGMAPVTPDARSTSQLNVIFTSSHTDVAQIVNGQIQIKGAGTAKITANCPGDATWEDAPPVSMDVVVEKAPLTITADNKTMVQGDPVPALTVRYNGFVYNETAAVLTRQPTVSTTVTRNTPPGNYPITVTAATAANYDITMVEGTLEVTARPKKQQTITFPALANITYGAAQFAPGASASSNLTVTYSTTTPNVVTIVNGQVKIVGTGTATVKASQAGNDEYEAAPDVSRTFAVQKATLRVKALDAQKEEGAFNPFLYVSYTGFVYGEDESVLTQRATPTTNVTTSTPPGVYDIFPGSAAAANYTMVYENGKLTVTPKPRQSQTITFPPIAAKRYGDADFAAGATTTSPLTVRLTSLNPAVATIVNGRIHIVKAGTATIRAEQDGNADYLPATPVERVLTVSKAILTASPQNATKVYLEPNPDIDIRYAGFVNGDDASAVQAPPVVNTQATQQSHVGEYEIWLTGGTAENYQFWYTEAKLTITPKAQTIQFTRPAGKQYGDADFTLTASATSNLAVRFVNETPDLIAITGSQVRILKAGTARIRAVQEGNTNWQPAPAVAQTFSIGKAPLTVTAENKSRVQGADNPVLTVQYTGFRNGDDAGDIQTPPTVSTTADRNSPPGTYEIVASGAAADNYSFTYVPGTLTVTARSQAQTITFPNLAARTYGDADFAPGATASSNLTVTYTSSNPRVATVVNGQLHIVGAGTSVITARQAGNDEWTAAAPVSRTLTVRKAPLTITAENKSKEVGAPTPRLTATYSGFVLGEGPAVLGTVTLRTPANEYSRAGRYPITIHVGDAANYDITTINGVVTVTAKPKDVVKAWASSRSTIQVNVFVMSAQNANVLLYSTSGQRVVQLVKRLDAGNNTFQLDVSHVPTGMYILQIGGEKINLTQNVAIN